MAGEDHIALASKALAVYYRVLCGWMPYGGSKKIPKTAESLSRCR